MVRATILVYLEVHALACMSEASVLSTSVNQPWSHFEPPPNIELGANANPVSQPLMVARTGHSKVDASTTGLCCVFFSP